MHETKWARVARVTDLEGDGPHHVSSEGSDAVVLKVDGELRAFDGLCPHQGALLGEGSLVDGKLVCANHGWCFDVETGKRDRGSECLRRVPLRVVDGAVELDLSVLAGGGEHVDVIRSADLTGPSTWSVMKAGMRPGGLDTLHLWWEEQTQQFGKTYSYMAGGQRIVVTSEPEIIAAALRMRPDKLRRADNLRAVFEDLNAINLFVEEGEAWRPLRRLVIRALTGRTLKDFFPTMRRVTGTLQARWEKAAVEGRVLDIREELFRFTVDITTTLTFGVDTNLVGGEESWLLDRIGGILPLMAKRAMSLMPIWKMYKSRADRLTEARAEEVREWVAELTEETRARQAEQRDAFEPQNFLESMLVARDEDGNLFDADTIFGNALIILLAGEDTTANTLAWAIHLLLDHPEEEAALRQHLASVLGDNPLPESLEVAAQLDHVERVANEALRLRSPAPNIGLAANDDVVVGNLELGKDDFFVALTRLAATDPDNIADAASFQPSRWDDPKTAAALQRSGAFAPFGSGPRICPGRSLALLEMRMLLAMLYQNFRVERVGNSSDVEEVFGFAMLPRGIRIRLHPRE